MATYQDKKLPARVILYACLIGFGMVFIFPFFWMICTSVKMPREMARSDRQLLPKTPNVVKNTPYCSIDEYEKIKQLNGTPEDVWKKALPKIEKIIQEKVSNWTPILIGGMKAVEIPVYAKTEYQQAMQRGIINVLSKRISDNARETAFNLNREIFLTENPDAKKVPSKLAPEAVDAGVDAIVKDAQYIINEKLLKEVFDRIYRRICLSSVKVREDYKIKDLNAINGWQIISGDTELEKRISYDTEFELATIDFSKNKEAVYQYKIDDVNPEAVDRFFVGYRSDESWDRITFEVSMNGKIYRTKNIITLADEKWAQVELRWYDANINPSEKKIYFFLYDTGKTTSTQDFILTVKIKKTNLLVGWYDKIMRCYREVFRQIPFLSYILTSVSLCILNILLAIFSCTFIAYAFSRLEWPGRNSFFALMIATMMVPAQVTMIPSFLINRYLGFYNTLIPLWIFSAFGSAFFIFLLRQFMLTIPKDLEDAARIDGCGFIRIYVNVILPLVKPTIATIALFTFTGTWNNFMGPLIYINDESKFPLALGLFKFNLTSGGDTGLMMAASFLMTLPIILLFFYAQRYFIEGITLTGSKD